MDYLGQKKGQEGGQTTNLLKSLINKQSKRKMICAELHILLINKKHEK